MVAGAWSQERSVTAQEAGSDNQLVTSRRETTSGLRESEKDRNATAHCQPDLKPQEANRGPTQALAVRRLQLPLCYEESNTGLDLLAAVL